MYRVVKTMNNSVFLEVVNMFNKLKNVNYKHTKRHKTRKAGEDYSLTGEEIIII